MEAMGCVSEGRGVDCGALQRDEMELRFQQDPQVCNSRRSHKLPFGVVHKLRNHFWGSRVLCLFDLRVSVTTGKSTVEMVSWYL